MMYIGVMLWLCLCSLQLKFLTWLGGSFYHITAMERSRFVPPTIGTYDNLLLQVLSPDYGNSGFPLYTSMYLHILFGLSYFLWVMFLI